MYVLFRVLFVYFILLHCLLFICVRLTRDLINATYLLTYELTRILTCDWQQLQFTETYERQPWQRMKKDWIGQPCHKAA